MFMEILSKEVKIFGIKIIIFKISYIKTDMSKKLNKAEYLKIKKLKIHNLKNAKDLFKLIQKSMNRTDKKIYFFIRMF